MAPIHIKYSRDVCFIDKCRARELNMQLDFTGLTIPIYWPPLYEGLNPNLSLNLHMIYLHLSLLGKTPI